MAAMTTTAMAARRTTARRPVSGPPVTWLPDDGTPSVMERTAPHAHARDVPVLFTVFCTNKASIYYSKFPFVFGFNRRRIIDILNRTIGDNGVARNNECGGRNVEDVFYFPSFSSFNFALFSEDGEARWRRKRGVRYSFSCILSSHPLFISITSTKQFLSQTFSYWGFAFPNGD